MTRLDGAGFDGGVRWRCPMALFGGRVRPLSAHEARAAGCHPFVQSRGRGYGMFLLLVLKTPYLPPFDRDPPFKPG
jgi:hypothetical protein